MSYDLHIPRAEHWSGNRGCEILPDAWLSVVDADPTLTLALHYGPTFAIWRGVSQYQQPWFDVVQGNVSTKNPDMPMIVNMLEIAQKLHDLVQGDRSIRSV